MKYLVALVPLTLFAATCTPIASAAECEKAEYYTVDGRYFMRDSQNVFKVCYNVSTKLVAMRASETSCPTNFSPTSWEVIWRMGPTAANHNGGCAASIQFIMGPAGMIPERAIVLMRPWPRN